jgi:ATP-dependent DNA helicase DinG
MPEPGLDPLPGLTRLAFAPGGVVEQIMGEHRPLQGQLAETIARHMARGRNEADEPGIGLGSASVGLGKTLAYSVVLLLRVALARQPEPDPADSAAVQTWRRQRVRGLISTFTIGLREQLVPTQRRERPGDLDRASRIVSRLLAEAGYGDLYRKPVTFGIRPSRTAYLSPERVAVLQTFLSRAPLDSSDAFLAREFVAVATEALRTRPLFEIQEFFETYDCLPLGLDPLDLCLTDAEADRLPDFRRLIEASHDAEILVVTHAMLSLHNLTFHVLLDPGATGRLAAVVIDEADRLPAAAGSATASMVNLVGLHRSLEGLALVPPSLRQPAEAALRTLRRRLDRLFNSRSNRPDRPLALVPLASHGDLDDLLPQLGTLRDTLSDLRDGLPAAPETIAAAGYLEATEEQLRHFIEMFEGPASSRAKVAGGWTNGRPVIQWTPGRDFPRIGVAAQRPGWLTNTLWRVRTSRVDSVYLLSGSLLAGEGLRPDGRPEFRWFRRIIGAHPNHNIHEDLLRHFDPPRFGRMEFVLADRRVPPPSAATATIGPTGDAHWTNPRYLDYVATMIGAAHRTPAPRLNRPGRVLVLCSSHQDKQALHDRLHGRIRSLVLHRPGEGISRLLDDFRRDPACVLLTTHWEGIDLPGLVDNIVITRLPIRPSSEAGIAVAQLMLDRGGLEASRQRASGVELNDLIEMAVHRLLQGLGRGIRTPDDCCRVWIADPRFPLPASLIPPGDTDLVAADERLGQRFVPAVPPRFRNSLFAPLNNARILSLDGTLWETAEAAE